MSTTVEENVNTKDDNDRQRRKRTRRRRRRKKKITNDDEQNDRTNVEEAQHPQIDPPPDVHVQKCDDTTRDPKTSKNNTKKKRKKHKGYRKRRRKKKSEVPTSPRLDELLRVAESLQQRQQQMFAMAGGRSASVTSPFWFRLDSESPSNGNENLDEPKDLSWLAQRAAMAGMGITPIDTTTLHPPRRIARVNSWGRHTTSLDPIYNERKGSNDSEKIRRLLSGRFTSVDDEEKEEEEDEKVVKEGCFSSTHLEQIFSPSWGEETEAWQRERLKQWVIWAEEQERTARVRET